MLGFPRERRIHNKGLHFSEKSGKARSASECSIATERNRIRRSSCKGKGRKYNVWSWILRVRSCAPPVRRFFVATLRSTTSSMSTPSSPGAKPAKKSPSIRSVKRTNSREEDTDAHPDTHTNQEDPGEVTESGQSIPRPFPLA